jgi:membrane-associated phospholipid phosphatase
VRLSHALLALGILSITSTAAAGEVRWRDEWSDFRSWQYASTALLFGGGIALRYAAPDPDHSDFSGVLFDDWVAEDLSIHHEPTRWAFATVTDALSYGAVGYRLIDSTLVPGLAHDDWEVAREMTLIDLQAYAVMVAVLWGSQTVVGRERPINSECTRPEVAAHEKVCEADNEHRYRSFISGHVALGVAVASLTCLHHANLPLYGGGSWDRIACGTTIAVAGSIAVGRSVTQNHWATDSLLGALLGFGAGYLLPAALHYGFDGEGVGTSSAALSGGRALPLLSLGGPF